MMENTKIGMMTIGNREKEDRDDKKHKDRSDENCSKHKQKDDYNDKKRKDRDVKDDKKKIKDKNTSLTSSSSSQSLLPKMLTQHHCLHCFVFDIIIFNTSWCPHQHYFG